MVPFGEKITCAKFFWKICKFRDVTRAPKFELFFKILGVIQY